ncbi:uncharacterized protein LOC129780714 [Toxorhynchites rutilus septentrionalis]|uniref:uncharacterized protein LOC129780714 n=1 Tax=Toxorhynchites rutilus septentrionalis TaxID=329112 RepID=UPI00247B0D2A|nr:uncharacterized protein LOC129780714 [Toxorhynchites rutilus septentrionalis]
MSRPGSNLDQNETVYNCGSCARPDHDESQMVYCESCERWFHFTCQQVTSDVKDDATWVCIDCSASGGNPNPPEHTDPVDAELAEEEKALTRERELFQKQMKKRMELAKMKLRLEKEKREMEWEFEKQEMKRRIAAEEEFNRKRQIERDWMQRKLDSVINERSEIEGRLKKKEYKAMSKTVDERLRLTEATSSEFSIGKPSSSTPLEDRTAQNIRKSEQTNQKHQENDRETPRRNPSVKTKKDLSKETQKKKVVVQVGGGANDSKSKHAEHDSDNGLSTEERQTETCAEVISEISDSEEEEICSNKSLNIEMERLEITPTKAQLSARQFLSKRLPTFSGKPEEWVMFITTYQTTTKACGFSNLENLARLQECLKGPALEAVYTRLLLPSSVPRIIEELREQFGQPEQVLDTLMAKIHAVDAPKVDKPASLIHFGRLIQQLCDHLEATDLKDHLINPMLIRQLAKKLSPSTKLDWIRFKRNECSKGIKITLSTFAEFLSEIVSVATEAVNIIDGPADNSHIDKTRKIKPNEREGFLHAHGASENEGTQMLQMQNRRPCLMCGEINHRLRNCQDFWKLSVYQRLQAVDGWELCRICLNAHGNARCRMNIRCRVANCQERHNTLLHQEELQSNCNMHSMQFQQPIIFRMIPVVLSHGDKSVNTLAFLDEGSSYTLIESSLTKYLQCPGVTWTAGMTRLERYSQKLDLSISAQGSTEKFSIRNAHTVEKLQLPIQRPQFDDIMKRYEHLSGLPVINYPEESPRILIGLKDVYLFAPLESRVGNPGEPIAVRSILGWTIYGPVANEQSQANIVGHHSCTEISNQELHDLLKFQYTLEESDVSVEFIPESDDVRRAREIMERTTVRIGERYQTGLLWKEDVVEFPNSFPMAMRRMEGLKRRLAKNQELLENVKQQIVEYQNKGYCHKATKKELTESDPKRVWYLPLNVVLNPKKPGKVRLVWDAAAVVEGISLNSKLLKGPDFLTSLPSIICKFREHLIGFGGDIREMFHQIYIRPEDRQAQRFVFESQIYVMDRAIFGATCCPSQALYVKDTNAKEFASIYPEASTAVINKHYVDDYYDSVETVDKAVKRAKEVREIHSKAGYEIRNWISNSTEFMKQLGEIETNRLIHFHCDKESGFERVLGVVWDIKEHIFTFSMQMRSDLQPYLVGLKHPTKRIVLSCVMSLFDPLGLLAVFTIHGRILIQDLWRSGCDWDEMIDEESMQKWKRWTSCLIMVESIKVPRYYFGNGCALDTIKSGTFEKALNSTLGTNGGSPWS